jgi:hypothetical protein
MVRPPTPATPGHHSRCRQNVVPTIGPRESDAQARKVETMR